MAEEDGVVGQALEVALRGGVDGVAWVEEALAEGGGHGRGGEVEGEGEAGGGGWI